MFYNLLSIEKVIINGELNIICEEGTEALLDKYFYSLLKPHYYIAKDVYFLGITFEKLKGENLQYGKRIKINGEDFILRIPTTLEFDDFLNYHKTHIELPIKISKYYSWCIDLDKQNRALRRIDNCCSEGVSDYITSSPVVGLRPVLQKLPSLDWLQKLP